MTIALKVEGEITADGHLVVDLPPEVPQGRVVVTLELVPEDDLDLEESDLQGAGLAAEEIARSPEIGAWADDPGVPNGADYVDKLRRSSARYSW